MEIRIQIAPAVKELNCGIFPFRLPSCLITRALPAAIVLNKQKVTVLLGKDSIGSPTAKVSGLGILRNEKLSAFLG